MREKRAVYADHSRIEEGYFCEAIFIFDFRDLTKEWVMERYRWLSSNIYAVGQPSIAAAGHSLLAVSATIFWFQNQRLTIPSLREIERTHSIHTFFVWEWCWEKERRLLWSFDIIEGRGLDLKPWNRVPSASPAPRALTSKGSHWEKQKLMSERFGL